WSERCDRSRVSRLYPDRSLPTQSAWGGYRSGRVRREVPQWDAAGGARTHLLGVHALHLTSHRSGRATAHVLWQVRVGALWPAVHRRRSTIANARNKEHRVTMSHNLLTLRVGVLAVLVPQVVSTAERD